MSYSGEELGKAAWKQGNTYVSESLGIPSHGVWVGDGHERWWRKGRESNIIPQKSSNYGELHLQHRELQWWEASPSLSRSQDHLLKLRQKQSTKPVTCLVFGIHGLPPICICWLLGESKSIAQTLGRETYSFLWSTSWWIVRRALKTLRFTTGNYIWPVFAVRTKSPESRPSESQNFHILLFYRKRWTTDQHV
jgi:hypothetical protein